MIRQLAAVVLTLLTASALAFQPRTGHWWNPYESGSGYNIDIQDGVLVITTYSYQPGGLAQWYIASGPMTNDQHSFTGTLAKFTGGQCISCSYQGMPTPAGNDGTISISFTNEVTATLTLPGNRTTRIQPFNFGFGDPPNGLLGQWVFVYDIESTWADRFTFTTVIPGTDNGNGIAADFDKICGCEWQVRGELAGIVICADGDSEGNLENAYAFGFGLDETYAGIWVAPDGSYGVPMTGFKVTSKNGFTRAGTVSSGVAAPTSAEKLLVEEKRSQAAVAGAGISLDQANAAAIEAVATTIVRVLRAQ